MCQKPRTGVSNSTGIREPSGVSRGVRVTRHDERSPVRSFRISSFMSVGNVREQSTMAPWSLTATVSA